MGEEEHLSTHKSKEEDVSPKSLFKSCILKKTGFQFDCFSSVMVVGKLYISNNMSSSLLVILLICFQCM